MMQRLQNGGDQDDRWLEILEQVELKSFGANPATIGPFGASIVSWDVAGPSGFSVQLNGQTVARTAHEAVQPLGTTGFNLAAKAGPLSRTLGTVRVTVDTSQCTTNFLVNPRSSIVAPIIVNVNDVGGVTFRDGSIPTVTFSPGRIRIQMYLSKSISYFPDPDVDIDMSFGLAVTNGALQSTAEQVNVNISVPFWAWGIPGAVPALAIAIDGATSDTRKAMFDAIQGLVALLNFLLHPPEGFRMQDVTIDDGNNGAGVLQTTQCPNDLVRALARVSAVAAPLA